MMTNGLRSFVDAHMKSYVLTREEEMEMNFRWSSIV